MRSWLALVALLGCIGGLGAAAQHVVGAGIAESTRVLERTGKLRLLATEVTKEVLVQDEATQQMLLDPEAIGEVSEVKIAAYDRQNERMAELARIATDERVHKLTQEIQHIDDQDLKPLDEQLLEKMAGGELDEGRALYRTKYLPARAKYSELINELSAMADVLSTEAEAALHEQTTRTVRMLGAIFLALAAVVAGLFMVNRSRRAAVDASNRLQRLVEITQRLLATHTSHEAMHLLRKDLNLAVGHEPHAAETTFGPTSMTLSLGDSLGHLVVPAAARTTEDRGFWQSLSLTVSQHLAALAARRVIEQGAEQLRSSEAQTRAVLQSLSEGLVVVDVEQRVQPLWSRALETVAPLNEGVRLSEWLFPDDAQPRGVFDLCFAQLVEDIFPFEASAGQFPATYERDGRSFAFSVSPVRTPTGALERIIFTLRDVTEETRLRRASLEARDLFQFLEREREQPDEARAFVKETRSELAGLHEELPILKRRLHTVKGTSAVFGLQSFAEQVHVAETSVEEAGKLLPDVEGELRTSWNAFEGRVRPMLGEHDDETVTMPRSALAPLSALLERHGEVEGASWVRGLTLSELSGRLNVLRLQAEASARKLGKSVEVDVRCAPLRMEMREYGPFFRSLVHVVRNAVDHGLEPTEARRSAGKSETGHLTLEVAEAPSGITVMVADDGRGVDFGRVAARAAERKLPHATHDDLVAAIFADGFSTRDEVTELSGRGVGLAAVWAECKRLGGRVEVVVQQGTQFKFHLPTSPAFRVVRPLVFSQEPIAA